MSVVRLEHVTRTYTLGTQVVTAVSDVSMSVDAGVFLAIAGPSGSGKSTLLNLIGCIDTPTKGRLWIGDQEVTGRDPDQLADLRARTIGFIFQSFNLLPVLTAEENVEYPLLQFPELTPTMRKERIARFLELVQLGRFARHRPNQLSGGQRQRVAIARALVTNPKIVLADEPTANLDHATGEGILELMKSINRDLGTTFVFSTHDEKVVSKADRLVRMEDGHVHRLAIRNEGRWVMVRDRRSRSGHRRSTDDERQV